MTPQDRTPRPDTASVAALLDELARVPAHLTPGDTRAALARAGAILDRLEREAEARRRERIIAAALAQDTEMTEQQGGPR